MADSTVVRMEDVAPVRSRVSWGAIFAGSAIALAVYFLLTLLGAAIGLSVMDRAEGENLGMGAAIWAVISMLIALFVGGLITSQCTVGENKTEAAVHAVIMWGVFFAMILWLMASGIRSGFNAMLGMANLTAAAGQNLTREDWETAAMRFGVSREQLADWRQKAANAPDAGQRFMNDPQNRQAVSENATKAAWWAFGGTLLSMLAAIGGGLIGAGPNIRLLPVSVSRVGVGREAYPH